MAFPTPTSIGETYFDSSSGRRWICSSLNPVVWSVDKSATLILGPGGLSSSGFSQFGNGLKISGGLTAIGNVAISGNLTVGGAVITTLSEVVQIEDNIIQLNSNATVGASGGIEMYRGVDGSRYILWDEDLDRWRFTNDGVNYVDLGAALSLPIATSSITGVAFFPNADFSVTPAGGVSLTGNVARTHIGQTFTGLQVFSSGLSANGLTGTLMTAAQPNITAVGTLTSLNTAGLTSSQRVSITNGGLSVVGNIDGTIGTAAQPNITSLGTLTSLNTAGLTSSQRINVSSGGIVVQAGGLSVTGGANLTGGSTFFGDIEVYDGAFIRTGGLSVTGGIAGTIVTPAQTNITSVGVLNGLSVNNGLSVTGGIVATGGININGGGISVTGGIAGTILTASQTNITAVGTLTSLNTAGITSSQRVNVSSGGLVVQAGGLSVTGGVNITGGAIFAGGLTSLGQVFVVAGQTANFFGSIVVSGNNIGIPDLTYETNAGITWPSSSVPTYTLGDRWTNGANEYTWVGDAWVEINNAVSSAPFDSIPDGSVTPAKLSTGKPTWDSGGTVYVSNILNVTGGQFIRTGGLSVTGGASITGNIRINSSTLSPIGVAPSYTARAWATFNGVGTISLTAGNVSSITDHNVGDYTVNFTTAMPHAQYAAVAMARNDGTITDASISSSTTPTTTTCRINLIQFGPTLIDSNIVCFIAVI